MKPVNSILLALFLFCSALFFTSCDNNNPITPGAADPKLRVINSSAKFNSLSIKIDSVLINSSLPYTGEIGFRTLSQGTHTVNAKGSIPGVTNETTLGMTLNGNTTHTWFVRDNASLGLSIVATTDNLSNPASGKFKMRVANISLATGSIDVKITGASGNLFSGVSTTSVSGYSEFDAGILSLEIRDSNTGNLYYQNSFNCESGKIYDLAVTGMNTTEKPIIFSVYTAN